MALRRVSVRNLRSLVDSQSFDLAPLMFAVGANSTGKSTFLRLFPLFRQSVEATTKGPVLWYGKYVDFGIFDTALSRNSTDREIEFEFEVDIERSERAGYIYGPTIHFLESSTAIVGLVMASDHGLTYTKRLRLDLFGRKVEVISSADGSVSSITLDGQPVSLGTVTKAELNAGTGLFSMAVSRKRSVQTPEGVVESWSGGYQEQLIPAQVLSYIRGLYHGRTSSDKTRNVANRLGLGSPAEFLVQLRALASNTSKSHERVRTITEESAWLKGLMGSVLIDRLPLVLGEINQSLVRTFTGIRYMGPVRAVAQRFYRQQDFSVNEIDQTGENLPMFLMGLSATLREEFSNWCHQHVGFRVEAQVDGAHVSVVISDSSSGESFNIADMGFGYSQILPLLATIWSGLKQSAKTSRKELTPNTRRLGTLIPGGGLTIVIEQPELHLHPRLQARFADLLVSISTLCETQNMQVRIICETHSEVIINRIGFRIAADELSSNFAKVFLFERNEDERTQVRTAEYDGEGILRNWPYGFFLPEIE